MNLNQKYLLCSHLQKMFANPYTVIMESQEGWTYYKTKTKTKAKLTSYLIKDVTNFGGWIRVFAVDHDRNKGIIHK